MASLFHVQETKELYRTESLLSGSLSSVQGKTMTSFSVIKVRDVHRGDQLAYDRGLYKHHMIVAKDPTDFKKVSVIHYYNDVLPGACGIMLCCGKSGVAIAEVRADVLDISTDVKGRRVYRIDYNECLFSPDEIVERAESKLGERKYSPFTNNCEHFVTWCKTDIHESAQVNVMIERAKHRAKQVAKPGVPAVTVAAVLNKAVKQVANEGAKTVMNEAAKTAVSEGTKSVATEGAKQVINEGAKAVMNEAAKTAVSEGTKSVAVEGAKRVAKEGNMPILHAAGIIRGGIVPGELNKLVRAGLDVTGRGFRNIAKDLPTQTSKQLAHEGANAVVKETSKIVICEGAKTVAGEGAKQVTREGGKGFMKTAMSEGAKVSAFKEGTSRLTKENTKRLFQDGGQVMQNPGQIGIGLTVLEESYYFYSRTRESFEKWDNGEISRSELGTQVASHVVKGVATGTATTVGSTLGQMLIPIPVVGGMVGGMAGKAAVQLGGRALQYLAN